MFQSNEGRTSGVCRNCNKLKNLIGGCHCDGTCSGCGLKPNSSGGCGCTRSAEPTTIETPSVDSDNASDDWMKSNGFNWEDFDSSEDEFSDGGDNS